MNLGLTYVQAKIYLSLAKLGVADTKSVAKSSGVARQDIYRIMSSLEVIGLVERSITKNLKYKATPTKEGLPLLLERKKTSVLDAEKQMRKFLSSFSGSPNRAEFEETNFTIVYESTLFTKKQRALCMSAKHTIEFVVPVNICHDMSIVQIDCLREATGRGVRIRGIGIEGSGKKFVGRSNPLIEFRYAPLDSLHFGMHIFDGHEVTLSISDKMLPSLWSNSFSIACLAIAFFENSWNNSKTYQCSLN